MTESCPYCRTETVALVRFDHPLYPYEFGREAHFSHENGAELVRLVSCARRVAKAVADD